MVTKTKRVTKSSPESKAKTVVKLADGAIYKVINRKLLKSAEYNPRTIDPVSEKKLKKSIEHTGGLVQPPVFNERTGNLVSGHQRLNQLDTIKKTDDYELTVAVVDWPLEKEIEVNVLLNNQSLSGNYDILKLDELLSNPDIDISNTGFDISTLELMHMDYGVDLPEFLLEPSEVATAKILDDMTDEIEDLSEEANDASDELDEEENIALVKERKREFAERQEFMRQGRCTLRLIFPSDASRAILMQHLGIDGDAEFCDGAAVLEALGLKDEMIEAIEESQPKHMKKRTRKKTNE